MRGTNGGCWYTRPLRIEPEFGQVPENLSEEIPGKEPWDVLQKRVSWSKDAKKSGELRPEPTFVIGSSSPSSHANGLAGESSADEIDGVKFGSGEFADVSVAGHVGPVLSKDALAELVSLNLPTHLKPSSFESKVQSAYAAEE